MFLSLTKGFKAAVSAFSRKTDLVNVSDLSPTPVVCALGDGGAVLSVVNDVAATQGTVSTASAALQPRVKRQGVFRRTNREIELGLSREQCIELRGMPVRKNTTIQAKPVEVKPIVKAKRFRRTPEELRLGLSIEQAAAARGEPVRKTTFVLRPMAAPIVVGATVADALIGTLTPRIQARARAVQRYRMGGGKTVLTKDTLDDIARFTAAGKVTVCPPFISSDGFNHLTGAEAPTTNTEAA